MLTSRLALYGGATLAVLSIIAGGWYEVDHILGENASLHASITIYKDALSSSQAATNAALKAVAQQAQARKAEEEALEAVRRTADEATSELNRLRDTFARHNLEAIAHRRPGLLERHINDGTARLSRLLEQASGGSDDGAGRAPAASAPQAAAPKVATPR